MGSDLEDTDNSEWNIDPEESKESTSDGNDELEIMRTTDTGCCHTRKDMFMRYS